MENSMPLVSVVVPCYNHEYYVEKTIESIVNQTYKNIELIVIDDGSKDNSVKVIQELADKNGFTFIHRANKGLSATLNEGIKLSKGKYFCVCASDDYYVLDKIEKQVAFMEDNSEYGMCYGNIIKFDSNYIEKKHQVKNAKSGLVFEDLIYYKFIIPAVTVMIKQDVFNEVGYFDQNLQVEDYDMWLRISNKYKVGYLNEFLAYYRIHESNTSKQIMLMYENKKKTLEKWKEIKNYDEVISFWKLFWFNQLAGINNSEARMYIKVALMKIWKRKSLIGLSKFFFKSIYIKQSLK